MKALVYHGPGKRSWDEKPKPKVKAATEQLVKLGVGRRIEETRR